MVPLARSTCSRERLWRWSQRQEGCTACHHWGPVSGIHMHPQSPHRVAEKKKRGHCNQAPYTVALMPLGTHRPAAATVKLSGPQEDTWSLSFPGTPQLGTAGAAPPAWAKWDRVLLVWSACSGSNHSVILDSRVGHGPLSLGMPEQKSLADPTTSEGTTEKDIAMECHLLVLSHPWEHTHPAAAAAKCSGQCPHA